MVLHISRLFDLLKLTKKLGETLFNTLCVTIRGTHIVQKFLVDLEYYIKKIKLIDNYE